MTKRPRHWWTPAEDEALARAWETGMPTPLIARMFGMTTRAVTARALRIGLPPHWTPWTDEDEAELRRLWKEGVPPAEIARRLKRTLSAMFSRTQLLNLPRRKPRRN